MGRPPLMVWHRDTELPKVDLIVVPGGFSYGDYLRCGAMAAHSPIMREVIARAGAGTPVLGICNGFQILTEAGLLPGALIAKCKAQIHLQGRICASKRAKAPSPANTTWARWCAFPSPMPKAITLPIPTRSIGWRARAGSPSATAARGRGAGGPTPTARPAISPASSMKSRTVLGLMPHPERLAEDVLGGTDGKRHVRRPGGGVVVTKSDRPSLPTSLSTA